MEDISQIFIEILTLYPEVEIPQFGIVYKKRVSGVFDEGNNVMFPPRIELCFTNQVKNTAILSKYLLEEKKFSPSAAEFFISQFLEDFNTQLRTKGYFKITQVGVFLLKDNVVFFESDFSEQYNKDYFGLPRTVINLKKVTPPKVEENIVEQQPPLPPPNIETLPLFLPIEQKNTLTTPIPPVVNTLSQSTPAPSKDVKVIEEEDEPARRVWMWWAIPSIIALLLGGYFGLEFWKKNNVNQVTIVTQPQKITTKIVESTIDSTSVNREDSLIKDNNSNDISNVNLNVKDVLVGGQRNVKTEKSDKKSAIPALEKRDGKIVLYRAEKNESLKKNKIRYDIISQSFTKKQEAQNHLEKLEIDSPKAKIIFDKAKNLYRVSLGSFETKEAAEDELNAMPEEFAAKFWIMELRTK